MWDSGVSRDEPLGSASLNLEMALENSIQVHLGRGGAARDLLIYLGSASLEMSLENSIQVRWWGETWGLLSYRGAIVCLHLCLNLLPPLPHPPSPSLAQDRWLQLVGEETGEVRAMWWAGRPISVLIPACAQSAHTTSPSIIHFMRPACAHHPMQRDMVHNAHPLMHTQPCCVRTQTNNIAHLPPPSSYPTPLLGTREAGGGAGSARQRGSAADGGAVRPEPGQGIHGHTAGEGEAATGFAALVAPCHHSA